MIEEKKKIDDKIMKLLNVSEVRRIICGTDKGVLNLVIQKGGNNYFLTLDSVPLNAETNKELMDILFKKEVPEVKKVASLEDLKDIVDNGTMYVNVNKIMRGTEDVTDKLLGKKRGRPAKTK